MRVANLYERPGPLAQGCTRAASADFHRRLEETGPPPRQAAGAIDGAIDGASVLRAAAQLHRRGGADAPSGRGSDEASALLAQQQAAQLQLLTLQHELTKGHTSALSNVMRVRHETTKNAIGNIR